MNPLFQTIITNTILHNSKKQAGEGNEISNYKLAKGYRSYIISLKRHIKDAVLITAGIFSASFGFAPIPIITENREN